MVDFFQNGARTKEKRTPMFDLNQALPKEEDEEEEQREPSGRSAWLHTVPQKTWLHSHEPVQRDQLQAQQRAVHEDLYSVPMEHCYPDQSVVPRPFFHAEQQTLVKNTSVPQLEQHQFCEGNSGALWTERNDHIPSMWKAHSDTPSTLTQDFLVLHEKQNQQNSGGFWQENLRESPPYVVKSLSPVSPPAQRMPSTHVFPEYSRKDDLEVAVSQEKSSEGQAGPNYDIIQTRHHGGVDVSSKRRHERDNSLSLRDFHRRRRERSPSISRVGRSGRGRRSRPRTPPARGHRYSPRSRHYSPRVRYSPRRRRSPVSPRPRYSRSSPVSYRPKQRPWSPPPNRNTGLGEPGRNVFIAGFSFDTTERDLERKFSQYGRVKDVRIVRDRWSGESRGFAFLSLDRDENADAAIRGLNETEWNRRIVLVEKAKDT